LDINTRYSCGNCNKKIDTPGLCSKCLKRHDRVLYLVILVIWILAAICFVYYYVLFIK
jgi:hypothetical protein